ncbi:MAG: hypothetical protein AB3X46_06445 [Leptothrix ochracea]|uniref:hypothetical protein n=1 Tax=Leptothrix ochracea TaxID=735331 RepID=UPI0034E2BC32
MNTWRWFSRWLGQRFWRFWAWTLVVAWGLGGGMIRPAVASDLIGADDFLVIKLRDVQREFWQGPLIIRSGGTYSGHWFSDKPDVPAVQIDTAEPVVIQDCQIRSRSALIRVLKPGAQVTVRNCRASALNPQAYGRAHGRFFTAFRPDTVVIEHNLLENTAGIHLNGAFVSSRKIQIRFNRVSNIVGLQSNGMGGYLDGSAAPVQFLNLERIQSSAIDVGWNEIINQPDQSRVDDNIRIFNSRGGGPKAPLLIHDNFVRGGYPFPSQLSNYSGGGIVIDGVGAKDQEQSAYVHVLDNQVISTTNYGIGISAGYQNIVSRNRILGANRLTPGIRAPAANVGLFVRDYNGYRLQGLFRGNRVIGNVVGWHRSDGQRNDESFSDCEPSLCSDVIHWPEDVTLSDEAEEGRRWRAKLKAQRLSLGPSADLCAPPLPVSQAQRDLWLASAPFEIAEHRGEDCSSAPTHSPNLKSRPSETLTRPRRP